MYEQEKVRRDIIQMLIDGEKRETSAREVIGEDYREFCDSIVAEIPHMSRKEKVLVFIRDTLSRADCAARDLVRRPPGGSSGRRAAAVI